jgi:hypothetical protein
MHHPRLTGRFSSFPAGLRHILKRYSRHLRRTHGIQEPIKWIRRNYHKLPDTLLSKILNEPGKGRWKRQVKRNPSSFIKRVRHGNFRFAHYWTPRSGFRIRQLGRGAQRGFFSQARYKTLKAYGRGHGRGAH